MNFLMILFIIGIAMLFGGYVVLANVIVTGIGLLLAIVTGVMLIRRGMAENPDKPQKKH